MIFLSLMEDNNAATPVSRIATSFNLLVSKTESSDVGTYIQYLFNSNLPNYAFLQCESYTDTKQLLVVKTGVNEYLRARFAGQVSTSANTRSKVRFSNRFLYFLKYCSTATFQVLPVFQAF